MLAPRCPRAFVCLRCEARPHHLPSLSTWPRRRRHDDAAPPDALTATLAARSIPTSAPLRMRKTQLPPPILRRHKGKTIRQRSAPLQGMKTLGDESAVLVLEEVADLADADEDAANEDVVDEDALAEDADADAEDAAAVDDTPAEPTPPPDVGKWLREERQQLKPGEVTQRIHSLRPLPHGEHGEDNADPVHVSQARFTSLTQMLIGGFNNSQLAAYYARAKHVRQHTVVARVLEQVKGDTGTAANPVTRSEWHPGTTSLDERLPGLDIRHRYKSHPVSKKLLVDRILRDCWHLVLLEELEAPGEIELALEPWQLNFLTLGPGDTLLDNIATTRRVQLNLHSDHRVVRITADKTTAEYAADDIQRILQNAAAIKMNLAVWNRRLVPGIAPKQQAMAAVFTKQQLNTVSAMTRTVIQKISGSALSIRSHDAAAVSEAERILLKLLPLKTDLVTSVDRQRVDTATGTCYLLLRFMPDSVLDLPDRSKALGRNWIPMAPSAAKEEGQREVSQGPANPSDTDPDTGLVDRAVTAIKRFADPAPLGKATWRAKKMRKKTTTAKAIANWPHVPEFVLTADFGEALFPFTSTTSTTIQEDTTASCTAPLTFVPTIPSLAGLLTSPAFTGLSRKHTPSVIYEFIPLAKQPGFIPSQTYPELRIEMQAGRADAKPQLESLTLIFKKRIHDILLPDKAADIRLTSYARLELEGPFGEKAVCAWVEAVIANMESGGRLTAPNIALKVPKWTVPGFPPDDINIGIVNYAFTGVQLRQSVSGIMADTRVSYHTTQSGKYGAKTGALTAHYNSLSDKNLTDGDALASFVHSSLDVVDVVTGLASQTVPLMKAMNPRAVLSARRLRRQQENAARGVDGDGDGDENGDEEEGEEEEEEAVGDDVGVDPEEGEEEEANERKLLV